MQTRKALNAQPTSSEVAIYLADSAPAYRKCQILIWVNQVNHVERLFPSGFQKISGCWIDQVVRR